MKLFQFNMLEGCIDDDARLKRIGDLITSSSYDIVGLNEAPLAIDEIGREWGYKHSQVAVAEGRKYYVALLSKYPIHLLDMYSSLFHHSAIHAKILDIHFIVTHLDPHDSILREKEALLIKDTVSSIDGPLIVMGDLNSLSPLDQRHYEESSIKAILQNSDLLRRKFLNLEGDINYRPIEYLLEAGMTDVFDELDASAFTVPTRINKDNAHATGMRLDYVLVKRLFAADLRVRVMVDKITDSLSDHYPLECDWNTMQVST